jgi:tetratricopeptide (TPR) repeat protein
MRSSLVVFALLLAPSCFAGENGVDLLYRGDVGAAASAWRYESVNATQDETLKRMAYLASYIAAAEATKNGPARTMSAELQYARAAYPADKDLRRIESLALGAPKYEEMREQLLEVAKPWRELINLTVRRDAGLGTRRIRRVSGNRRATLLYQKALRDYRRGRWISARGRLRKARKAAPKDAKIKKLQLKVEAAAKRDASAKVKKGVSLFYAGRHEEARTLLNEALALDPTNRRIRSALDALPKP